MATHSSVLAWRIPGMAEPVWAAVYGVAQSRTRLKQLCSPALPDRDHDYRHVGDKRLQGTLRERKRVTCHHD